MKTGQGIIVVFLWGVARYLRSLFSGRSPRCVSGSYVIVLAQLLILLIPSAVYSQVNPPQLPPQAVPRRQVEPAEQLPSKPKPDPEIEEPEPVIQRVPFGADKVKIEKLNRIVIQGNTVYKADQLKAFYRDQLGKGVTLTDIYKIAERIQQKYRADDYRLTRVVVPVQAVKDGCIILRVVEGYIDDVRIEGNAAGLEARIKRYLDKVTGIEPVNERELERYLLLVNDLPGVSARGVLRPGRVKSAAVESSDQVKVNCDTLKTGQDAVGASELVVRVERDYLDGNAIINNRGSRFTGPWRATLVASANSVLDYGERLELIFLTAFERDEQRFVSLSYRQPIGTEGFTFNLSASYGPSKPGFTLEPLDLETETFNLNTSINYPIVRARRRNWFAGFGFEATNTDIDTVGENFSRDRLRVVYASTNYNFRDDQGGDTQIGFIVRKGLSTLGASSNNSSKLSRLQGRSDFTALQLFGSRLQHLIGNTNLYFALKGQYAFNTLLSVEEFRVGGEQFGRGYDPSELAGDHGLAANTEIQHTVRTPFEALPIFQLYGFYDFGVVWNRDSGVDSQQSLSSAGAGIRAEILKNLNIGLEVAQPLTREVATERDTDARAFLQVSARF